MLVDDDQDILDYTRLILEVNQTPESGILTLNNPMSAFNKIDQNIDVVVTDLLMPGIDGVRLASMIKEKFPSLPVVAMTGADQDIFSDLVSQKADVFSMVLIKPFKEAELISALSRHTKIMRA